MIYVRKDGTGYQVFPTPEDLTEYITVDGALEEQIVSNQPYELVSGKVELIPTARVQAERTAKALAEERAGLRAQRFQLLAALHSLKLLARARGGMQTADELIKLEWDEAVEFKRDSAVINALQVVIGITSTEMDNVFRNAKEIQ